MSRFSDIFPTLPLEALRQQSLDTTERTLAPILARGQAKTLADFAALLSPTAGQHLEALAKLSQRRTQQHFGKVIRLFAPIYLSNECVNICKYCGFSRENEIPRITIPVAQAVEEAQKLSRQGFRSLLIVAGEHPKYVSNGYVVEVIEKLLPIMPSLAIELGPMETAGYRPIVEAGCEALTVYQETYHEPTYRALHPAGPKKDFRFRMDTAERAYEAGFRRLGIGALYGLHDWRGEALATAAHARYLTQKCWKAQITVSFPRMRPASGGFEVKPEHPPSDRELAQLITAFRLFLPHAGLVLSTREPAHLRDGLFRLGITTMSAGSSTEPGGYSSYLDETWTSEENHEGEQFEVADERSPRDVAHAILQHGYEPVWKDFDQALVNRNLFAPTPG